MNRKSVDVNNGAATISHLMVYRGTPVGPGDGERLGQGGFMSVVKIHILTVPAEQPEILEKRFSSRAHAVEYPDGVK
jgi:hypothetical protein